MQQKKSRDERMYRVSTRNIPDQYYHLLLTLAWTTTTTTMNSDNKKRILLVDDEHDIALAFKISLQDNGFVVDTLTIPKKHYQISKLVCMICYLLM
ncbi:MAG: hypothetical protein ACJ72R_09735 [Nitrososphaeraceae archaeon]